MQKEILIAYQNLKNKNIVLYRQIFQKETEKENFQKANNAERINILKRCRYTFLFQIANVIAVSNEDKQHALELIPMLCFINLRKTATKNNQFLASFN